MIENAEIVRGTLQKGYGVASGPSVAYPYGALERQIPIFLKLGLDLTGCFRGTLNIDISPVTFRLVKPDYTFRGVLWTDLHPPEDFSFSICRIGFADALYDGWIYQPHPETKRMHHHRASVVEVITVYIAGVGIGDSLDLVVDSARVGLTRPAAH